MEGAHQMTAEAVEEREVRLKIALEAEEGHLIAEEAVEGVRLSVGKEAVEVHWIEVMAEAVVVHSIGVKEEEVEVQNLSKGVEELVESMQAAMVEREKLALQEALGVTEVHLEGQHENKNSTFLVLGVEVEQNFVQVLEEGQFFLVPGMVVVRQILTPTHLVRNRRLESLVVLGEVVDLGWILM